MSSKPSGISGSRAAAILGINGFTTKLAVWQEIMEEQKPGWNAAHGFLLPERTQTAAMRWGTMFENTIAKLSFRHFKKQVKNREQEYSDVISTKIPITCHIDGTIGDMLYEAKTTNSSSFNKLWGVNTIPASYQAQVQHNLYLANLKKAVVVCLELPKTPEQLEAGGLNETCCNLDAWGKTLYEMGYFHVYEIDADREKQEAMIQFYKHFCKSIKEEIPPEPENYDDIKRIFHSPRGILVLSDLYEAKLLEYRDIANQLSSTSPAAKRQEQLKVEILSWAQKYSDINSESAESLVIKNKDGIKLGSFGKNKNGTLIFRT